MTSIPCSVRWNSFAFALPIVLTRPSSARIFRYRDNRALLPSSSPASKFQQEFTIIGQKDFHIGFHGV
ncbi:MAG: hypothetical protein ACFE9L_17360 [Candidatus Hodarchaeota archaeon]